MVQNLLEKHVKNNDIQVVNNARPGGAFACNTASRICGADVIHSFIR